MSDLKKIVFTEAMLDAGYEYGHLFDETPIIIKSAKIYAEVAMSDVTDKSAKQFDYKIVVTDEMIEAGRHELACRWLSIVNCDEDRETEAIKMIFSAMLAKSRIRLYPKIA